MRRLGHIIIGATALWTMSAGLFDDLIVNEEIADVLKQCGSGAEVMVITTEDAPAGVNWTGRTVQLQCEVPGR
jgi:hypothetical protein